MILLTAPIDWAELVWTWIAGVAALAVLPLALGVWMLRRDPVRRRVRSGEWSISQHSAPGAGSLPSSPWRRAAAAIARWCSDSSLRVEPFGAESRWRDGAAESNADSAATSSADGAAVANAIAAAMQKVGSTARSGVEVVSAPVKAETAFSTVGSAFGYASQIQIVEAALQLLSRLKPREELRLTGHILRSEKRGPGLALSLGHVTGDLVDSVTLWACEYEPQLGGAAGHESAPPADRLQRLVPAAAVWTHFAALRHRNTLSPSDLRRHLGTDDWRSYAMLQVGVDQRDQLSSRAVRALYARAVDHDPDNLVAQFNLGRRELMDEDLAAPGRVRLQMIHDRLEHDERSSAATPRPPEATDTLPLRQWLVQRDPLHYQVRASLAAGWVNETARLALEHPTEPLPDGLETSFKELSADLRDVELTLLELERVQDSRRLSPEEERLAHVLRRLEGPMLVAWAQLDALFQTTSQKTELPTPTAGHRLESPGGPALEREDVERAVHAAAKGEDPKISHVQLVRGYILTKVELNSHTRYDLACYYAGLGLRAEALGELRASLAPGRTPGEWVNADPTLRSLQEACPGEWAKIVGPYTSGASHPLGPSAPTPGPEAAAADRAEPASTAS